MGGTVQENPGKRLWHTPRVKISGIPEGDAWPKPEQLISLLRTAPGRPVATQVQGPILTAPSWGRVHWERDWMLLGSSMSVNVSQCQAVRIF